MSENSLKDVSGDVALDTGLLIEFFGNTPLGKIFGEQILSNEEITGIYIHDYLIAELYYIICRQKGNLIAQECVKALLEFASVVPSTDLRLIAGKIKCERRLSLADCFSCSIAQVLNIPVFFKKENELEEEIRKRPFSFRLIMI